MREDVIVIGGGLAGSEAAWQAASRGARVTLYEMRPKETTPAHKTGLLAELVCSNSLGSREMGSAPGILKDETVELVDYRRRGRDRRSGWVGARRRPRALLPTHHPDVGRTRQCARAS